MATIDRHGTGWQARVRKRGHKAQTKTFTHKAAAEKWARDIERAIDEGSFYQGAREAERVTLDEALKRYDTEVVSKKRSGKSEGYRIKTLRATDYASMTLAGFRSTHAAALRDAMLERGLAAGTVLLYLATLSHLYTTARREWGYEGLANPIANIARPSAADNGRDRRLRDGELETLLMAPGAPAWLPAVITLAIETAMRRGELASITEQNIIGDVIRLRGTKNGSPRDIPITSDAAGALEAIRKIRGGLRMPHWQEVAWYFRKACLDTGIEGLRFHDLRHEATSRLFEHGLNIAEVASITGHKSWAMLKRYTHPRASDIAKKLAEKKKPAEAGEPVQKLKQT
jgi:integrase